MVDHPASSHSSVRSCALCTTPARYKCPRCAAPTCSLLCSRKHKENARCTGERDKSQYVPMNAYGWGTMMRDYCYLEEIGRKVSEWGSEIVRGGYMENIGTSKAASTRKFSNRRKPVMGKSKRDVLKAHLETLGIDVELLPVGMERRSLNQSTFDQMSKSPLLTIESAFYPPTTLAPSSSSLPTCHKILSHRNSLSATLLTVLQCQLSLAFSKSQKQKQNAPDWLPSLVATHPEAHECFVLPHCYVRANTEFVHAPNAVYYHKLDPTLCLRELLQRTSFMEFPTIHVFDPEASSFCGTVIDKSGSIAQTFGDDQINVARAVKRKKLNQSTGLKAVLSLVGEYGSEGSSQSGEEATDKALIGLATLESYSGSDDSATPIDAEADEDHSLGSDSDVSAEGGQVNCSSL